MLVAQEVTIVTREWDKQKSRTENRTKGKELKKRNYLDQKRRGRTLNCDNTDYLLLQIYDQLLKTAAPPTSSFNIISRNYSVNLTRIITKLSLQVYVQSLHLDLY